MNSYEEEQLEKEVDKIIEYSNKKGTLIFFLWLGALFAGCYGLAFTAKYVTQFVLGLSNP